jgi:hypothetical protein
VRSSRTKQGFTAAGTVALIAWRAVASHSDKEVATPVFREEKVAVLERQAMDKSKVADSATRSSLP